MRSAHPAIHFDPGAVEPDTRLLEADAVEIQGPAHRQKDAIRTQRIIPPHISDHIRPLPFDPFDPRARADRHAPFLQIHP